ncbi:hypothetical protein Vafri_11407, partial [Volvox africanus]
RLVRPSASLPDPPCTTAAVFASGVSGPLSASPGGAYTHSFSLVYACLPPASAWEYDTATAIEPPPLSLPGVLAVPASLIAAQAPAIGPPASASAAPGTLDGAATPLSVGAEMALTSTASCTQATNLEVPGIAMTTGGRRVCSASVAGATSVSSRGPYTAPDSRGPAVSALAPAGAEMPLAAPPTPTPTPSAEAEAEAEAAAVV